MKEQYGVIGIKDNAFCDVVSGECNVIGEAPVLVFEYFIIDNNAIITGLNNGTVCDITIPSNINGCSVTKIDDCAFSECGSLTSITIPDTVISIGNLAFEYCRSLTQINVDDNNTNYSSENGVLFDKEKTTIIKYPPAKKNTNYVIPNSVTTIENSAFTDCTYLTSITIPNSVTTIGEYAFMYCSSITNITIPDSVTTIGKYAFMYCSSITNITIPNGVQAIKDYTFAECHSLTDIIIPNSVVCIGDWTFSTCTSLTNITIPNSVITIGEFAFIGCNSLTSLTIPDSVTIIEDWTFMGCSSLKDVTIPESVTMICENTFSYCDNIVLSVYKNSYAHKYAVCNGVPLKFIKDVNPISSFYYSIIGREITINRLRYKKIFGDVIIPSKVGDYEDYTVTKIGSSAFEENRYITSVTIPNGVTSIGNSAFESCRSLKSVTIPSSVISIGDKAFYFCFDVVLSVYENSYAHKYAVKKKIPFKLI